MNIPLSNVNLNEICNKKKHYVRDDEESKNSEFYVYGVQLINMKKILTIRCQYLILNQTLFEYEIHIRYPNSSFLKTVRPGESFPLPKAYD